jgi:hypothetical protein
MPPQLPTSVRTADGMNTLKTFPQSRDGSRFLRKQTTFPWKAFFKPNRSLFRTLKCALCRSTVRVLPYFMLNRYLSENIFLISGLVSNFFAGIFRFMS